jgi:hypothetical protein
LNSLPAPGNVMSRLFGNEDQWKYAQQVVFSLFDCVFLFIWFTQEQHPKDTPANAPSNRQSHDYGEIAAIELDPASAAKADLSGISMQQVHACSLSFLISILI